MEIRESGRGICSVLPFSIHRRNNVVTFTSYRGQLFCIRVVAAVKMTPEKCLGGKISTENRKTGTPLGKIGDDDLFNDFAISIQDNNALMKLNVKYSKAKACYLFPRYWRCFEISIERSTDIVDQRLSCDIPAGARK